VVLEQPALSAAKVNAALSGRFVGPIFVGDKVGKCEQRVRMKTRRAVSKLMTCLAGRHENKEIIWHTG